MAWGLIKKVVIADRLSPFVDAIYFDPTQHNGLSFIVATFFFSIQIYCDFSGYSDIALGAAKTMGFDLMKNFDRPYFSSSIAEFWRKWHISLSTWFRDYLYIPLGGNKGTEFKKYFNLSIVFLISGLWHGNTWCFVLWGGIHAFYQIFGQKTKGKRESIIHFLKIDQFPTLRKTINIATVFVLVSFAWIFFRAIHTEYAFYIVKNMFVGWPSNFEEFKSTAFLNKHIYLTKPKEDFFKAIFAILLLILVEFQLRKGTLNEILDHLKSYKRWIIYYLAILIFLFFGVFDNPAEFIYFQF